MSSNMISSYNKEIIQGFFFLMYYIITRTCSLCPSLIKLILITYFICPHSDLGFFCPLSNGLSFPCILLIHSKNMRCHQLRRILFILLSIYRKSRKIRYFGCRSKDSSSSSSSSSHDSSTSLLFILDFSLPTDSFLERTLSGFFVFIQGLMTHLKIN